MIVYSKIIGVLLRFSWYESVRSHRIINRRWVSHIHLSTITSESVGVLWLQWCLFREVTLSSFLCHKMAPTILPLDNMFKIRITWTNVYVISLGRAWIGEICELDLFGFSIPWILKLSKLQCYLVEFRRFLNLTSVRVALLWSIKKLSALQPDSVSASHPNQQGRW